VTTSCQDWRWPSTPDGSTPEVIAVVRAATFLFAAGQETSARMLAQAVRYLAEDPSLQVNLREHPERIPNFIEETLWPCSLERPTTTRASSRLPTSSTPIVPTRGSTSPSARGIHTCPGSPLARAEGGISIERLLRRTRNIRLSEAHHGPAADRRFSYEPTWMLRAMEELHIEFDSCPQDD
jgi:cytochrome P450